MTRANSETVCISVMGLWWDVTGVLHRGSRGNREQPDEPAFFEVEAVCLSSAKGENIMEFANDRFLDRCAAAALAACRETA